MAIAEATPADLEQLTAIHLESLDAEANIASLFGPAFVRAAYSWFIRVDEAFVLTASIDGEIVGFTSGSDVPYTLPMLKACRAQLLLSLLLRPWLALHPRLLERLWSLARKADRSVQGVAQIAYTAVSPRYRGRGVAFALKVASIRRCRERGSIGILTGISDDNSASIRLNERLGFRRQVGLKEASHHYYLLRFADNEPGEAEIAADSSTHQHCSCPQLQGSGT